MIGIGSHALELLRHQNVLQEDLRAKAKDA